jgi:hypothetical protein
MGASKSILSYNDAKEVFERAAANPTGVRLTFEDGPKARDFFMFRLWEFRKLDRDQNRILYPDPVHSMHGKSFFDTFSVKKIGHDRIEVVKINLDRIKVVDF